MEKNDYKCGVCGMPAPDSTTDDPMDGMMDAEWMPEAYVEDNKEGIGLEYICPVCCGVFNSDNDGEYFITLELYERLKDSYKEPKALNYKQKEIQKVLDEQLRTKTNYSATLKVKGGEGTAESKWLSVDNDILVWLVKLLAD